MSSVFVLIAYCNSLHVDFQCVSQTMAPSTTAGRIRSHPSDPPAPSFSASFTLGETDGGWTYTPPAPFGVTVAGSVPDRTVVPTHRHHALTRPACRSSCPIRLRVARYR